MAAFVRRHRLTFNDLSLACMIFFLSHCVDHISDHSCLIDKSLFSVWLTFCSCLFSKNTVGFKKISMLVQFNFTVSLIQFCFRNGYFYFKQKYLHWLGHIHFLLLSKPPWLQIFEKGGQSSFENISILKNWEKLPAVKNGIFGTNMGVFVLVGIISPSTFWKWWDGGAK